jgi:hypothetical protein
MSDTGFRIAELLLGGMKCSDVVMQLALDARGESNPALIKAMSGLAFGVGGGANCGAFTGGACVLGLVLGRGEPDGTDDPRLAVALEEFGGWFQAAMVERHGGINCADIMRFDEGRRRSICPALIGEVWERVNAVLAEQGADVGQVEDGR